MTPRPFPLVGASTRHPERPMTIPVLRVKVRGVEIMITLPGTRYSVTYHKQADSPRLVAKEFPIRDDTRAPITQAKFLARVWQLANDKARELGWIV